MSKQWLLIEANKGEKSTKELQRELNLPIGKNILQQVQRLKETIQYRKFMEALLLSKCHKQQRILWAT